MIERYNPKVINKALYIKDELTWLDLVLARTSHFRTPTCPRLQQVGRVQQCADGCSCRRVIAHCTPH